MSLEGMYNYLMDKLGSAADLILKLVFAVVVFVIARKLILWLCKVIRQNMTRFHAEEAVVSFVVSLVKYGLNILLVMTLIVQLGIVSEASLAAAIASAGVAISLALQGGLSNFAGGLMILLLKPFKVGDYIVFPGENMEGTVKKIEMYYTTLNSIDNRTIMIPNANLTNNTIINVTAMNRRKLEIKVGISYDADLSLAINILKRLVEEDPRFYPEEQQFFVDELGSSSIVVGMRAWLGTDDYWPTKWEMNERIKMEFDQEGITIPYQQLDVHLKSENSDLQKQCSKK
ncbi:MAG: mechanosensitive ion channel family protein [Fusicatenibacter sp.]|nr:mechanosensitive ion channel family protein [Lachnospiraceae bacterium]MDY2937017.1 mechanosensitive ion channel family protein [Fusicatenibacter sp.]